MARIMVTGASGYIGSVLVDHLLKDNHQVVAVDWMIFGGFPLKPFLDNPNFELLHQDIREIPVRAFRGIDTICDVAGLPDAACCAVDPVLSREINAHARARIARIAKAMGVKRHIVLTSCEPQGCLPEDVQSTRSAQTARNAYAHANGTLEQSVLEASAEEFSATVLRVGSVYGLSRRMRFDVLANLAALHAHRNRTFALPTGSQFIQPFIHVRDVARAALATLKAPQSSVSGQMFTLASQTGEVSQLIAEAASALPQPLNCVRAEDALALPSVHDATPPLQEAIGFEPRITLEQGMLEVFIALKGGRVQLSETTNTAKFYRSLVKTTDENGARRLT